MGFQKFCQREKKIRRKILFKKFLFRLKRALRPKTETIATF